MKSITVTFFLFMAFAIVLAHGTIPHHHHEFDHAHKDGNSHHSDNHTHHPAQGDHGEYHNLYTWFIYGKKDLKFSPNLLSDNKFSTHVNDCKMWLPDALIKKINLPPELNVDISNIDYCSNKLLRAPPFFQA